METTGCHRPGAPPWEATQKNAGRGLKGAEAARSLHVLCANPGGSNPSAHCRTMDQHDVAHAALDQPQGQRPSPQLALPPPDCHQAGLQATAAPSALLTSDRGSPRLQNETRGSSPLPSCLAPLPSPTHTLSLCRRSFYGTWTPSLTRGHTSGSSLGKRPIPLNTLLSSHRPVPTRPSLTHA